MVKMPKMMKKKKVEPVVEEKPNPFGLIGVMFEKIGPGGMLMLLAFAVVIGQAFGVSVAPPA